MFVIRGGGAAGRHSSARMARFPEATTASRRTPGPSSEAAAPPTQARRSEIYSALARPPPAAGARGPGLHVLRRDPLILGLGGIEGLGTESERVKRAFRGQVILDSDEAPCRNQKQEKTSPSTRCAACAPHCAHTCTSQDAIIADCPRLLDQDSVVPRITQPGEKVPDLLASVARPRLREPANRVIVAVGLPESGDELRELLWGNGFEPLLQVAPDDLDVLLRYRPLSISPTSTCGRISRDAKLGLGRRVRGQRLNGSCRTVAVETAPGRVLGRCFNERLTLVA